MATFIVTTLFDEVSPGFTLAAPGGTGLSLREAIALAGAAAGADTITFAPSLSGGEIRIENNDNDQFVIAAGQNLTIDGDLDNDGVADITIFSFPRFRGLTGRLFDIEAGATATLDGLVLRGGFAETFTTDDAISTIVNDGNLTLTNVVIEDARARVGEGIRVGPAGNNGIDGQDGANGNVSDIGVGQGVIRWNKRRNRHEPGQCGPYSK